MGKLDYPNDYKIPCKNKRWTHKCVYCGELTASGHLVPPSVGEPSFTVCATINRIEQAKGMKKSKDWTTVVSPVTPGGLSGKEA